MRQLRAAAFPDVSQGAWGPARPPGLPWKPLRAGRNVIPCILHGKSRALTYYLLDMASELPSTRHGLFFGPLVSWGFVPSWG